MRDLYIGLMSGTSLDGVDGVIADFGSGQCQVLAHASAPFTPELKAQLLALNHAGENELHRAALSGNALVRVYAEVVARLLGASNIPRAQVHAGGARGQTVRPRPQEFDGTGYTLQLCQPALLAELVGIDVVADFRSRDVAGGGQGGALAPSFLITGLDLVIPIKRGAAPHRIGMAGTSPAMTGEDVTQDRAMP